MVRGEIFACRRRGAPAAASRAGPASHVIVQADDFLDLNEAPVDDQHFVACQAMLVVGIALRRWRRRSTWGGRTRRIAIEDAWRCKRECCASVASPFLLLGISGKGRTVDTQSSERYNRRGLRQRIRAFQKEGERREPR